MKKNISINLFGALYAIDEDAYDLLEQYLTNMTRYFARREDGAEIADDIEHRVAELLAERRAEGVEAITIDHVREIISRIGDPKEMDDEAGTADEADASAEEADATDAPTEAEQPEEKAASGLRGMMKRHLYRDTDDRMLGGVLSGFCHFFGGTDPLPWRILAVILTLFTFSFAAIAYLIAWAIIPAADTDEQRLRMRGIPVTPENINRELLNRTAKAPCAPVAASALEAHTATGCLSMMLRFLILAFKVVSLIFLGTAALALIVNAGFLFVASFGGAEGLTGVGCDRFVADALSHNAFIRWELWGTVSAWLVTVVILIYAIVRSFFRHAAGRRINAGTRTALVVISLLGIAMGITLAAFGFSHLRHAVRAEERRQWTDGRGVYMEPDSRRALTAEGWTVEVAEGCNDNGFYTDIDGPFDAGGKTVTAICFNRSYDADNMSFLISKTANLPGGNYYIEAVTRADADGTAIGYGTDGNWMLTACGTAGGNASAALATMDYVDVHGLDIFADTLSEAGWNGGVRGKMGTWTVTRTPAFEHSGGPLNYCFTNRASGMKNAVSHADIISLRVVEMPLPPDTAVVDPSIF